METLLPALSTSANRLPSRNKTRMVRLFGPAILRAIIDGSCAVFLGYYGWAAGNFDPSYVLGETPTQSGSTWTDTSLVAACLAPKKK